MSGASITPAMVKELEGVAAQVAELATRAGADGAEVLVRDGSELTAKIRAILRRAEQRAAASTSVIAFGSVQVDLAGHRVLKDGRTLPLKPKVFELLAFLARNPGQVFSRDQLLEQVWGYDYAGETRTVDVHVHWLRSAIEADPADPKLIHTVRGVGYVLRQET